MNPMDGKKRILTTKSLEHRSESIKHEAKHSEINGRVQGLALLLCAVCQHAPTRFVARGMHKAIKQRFFQAKLGKLF